VRVYHVDIIENGIRGFDGVVWQLVFGGGGVVARSDVLGVGEPYMRCGRFIVRLSLFCKGLEVVEDGKVVVMVEWETVLVS
jgi:hypothetical protein